MPLSAAGGANAVNSQDGEIAGDSKQPAVKKPKGIEKTTQNAKKRGLKRL